MFVLCWCDWPNGLSANHHLSSVASCLFSFSCCCCLHTHMLSFHHNLSLSALLSISLWFSPLLAWLQIPSFFFYLQELFDLLTDFLYLYDLVMAFQQHVWEYIGRTRRGFSFSIIGPWKKKLCQLAWALRSIIPPTISSVHSNTKTFSPCSHSKCDLKG